MPFHNPGTDGIRTRTGLVGEDEDREGSEGSRGPVSSQNNRDVVVAFLALLVSAHPPLAF